MRDAPSDADFVPSSPALDPATLCYVAWAVSAAATLGAIASPARRRAMLVRFVRERLDADAGVATSFRALRNGGTEPLDRYELGWDDVAELCRARADLDRHRLAHEGRSNEASGGAGHAISATTSGDADDGRATWTRVDLYRGPGRPPYAVADATWLALLAEATLGPSADSPTTPAPATGRPAALAARLATLSPRERETLDHLLGGASEKEVACRIRRSRHTVHAYVKKIYRRLNVSSRAELLAMFVVLDGG